LRSAVTHEGVGSCSHALLAASAMGDARALQKELDFLSGTTTGSAVYDSSPCMGAKKTCEKLLEAVMIDDPFATNYCYANPWVAKKENKGKKDAPKRGKEVSL
jgi:hypothetical protein